jgi:hypothetical protein
MSFEALKTTVEALVKDERTLQQQESFTTSHRDYSIRYKDPENEMINVSDDEDLLTAYDLAGKSLDGNLKLVVEFKKSIAGASEKILNKTQLKAEKKKNKKMKKHLKKVEKVDLMLSELAIDKKDLEPEELENLESSSSSSDDDQGHKHKHKKERKHHGHKGLHRKALKRLISREVDFMA